MIHTQKKEAPSRASSAEGDGRRHRDGDGDDVAKRGVRARTRGDDDDANANAHDGDDASQCDDAGGDSGAHRGTVRRGRCADSGGRWR